VSTEEEKAFYSDNAQIVIDALEAFLKNNGASSSPCLDRQSHDINLTLIALLGLNRAETAKEWLKKLFCNVDYALKAKKFVPIATDSLDDLVEEGGWLGRQATERMTETSWMLATFAGWSVILGMDEMYEVLVQNIRDQYPGVCIQLWHPEKDLYQHLYFQSAHSESGVTEAPIPIQLLATASEYREQMQMICESEFGKVFLESPAAQSGLIALDFIAYRHFSTPVPPVFWYSRMDGTAGDKQVEFS
jgi:hypothetical protein